MSDKYYVVTSAGYSSYEEAEKAAKKQVNQKSLQYGCIYMDFADTAYIAKAVAKVTAPTPEAEVIKL